MVGVAFFTLLERKVLGYIQTRKGPNKPGPLGLLVPFADAVKLIRKEFRYPARRNKVVFFGVPCLTIIIPLILWRVFPSKFEALSLKYSALWFICVSAVGVYAILGAGWRSNSKYSMLGAVRAVAQSVSYEVRLSIIIIHWIVFFYFGIMCPKLSALRTFLFATIVMLLISSLAETNRSPFDFSEGESELVSGFNTEFSSVPFVMIFLAEYMSIIFISAVVRILFNMTGYLDVFFFLILWAVAFIWRRGTLPRLRYDQLIFLAWKCFLPVVLCSAGVILVL